MIRLDQLFGIPFYSATATKDELFWIQKEISEKLPTITANDDFQNPAGWGDGVQTNIKFRNNTIEDYNMPFLNRFILNHCYNYIKETRTRLPGEIKLSHSWINFTSNGQGQDWHNHNTSLIVGTYYYQTTGKDGNFLAKNPNPFAGVWYFPDSAEESSCFSVSPTVGKILLFPGYITHKVETNQTDNTRISISFNIDGIW